MTTNALVASRGQHGTNFRLLSVFHDSHSLSHYHNKYSHSSSSPLCHRLHSNNFAHHSSSHNSHNSRNQNNCFQCNGPNSANANNNNNSNNREKEGLHSMVVSNNSNNN